jgi:diguanylate cyclase (GGDEF)-like protein
MPCMKGVFPQKISIFALSRVFKVKLEPSWFAVKKSNQPEISDSRNVLVKAALGWQIRVLSFALFVGVIAFLILGLITAAKNIGSRNQSNTELARVNELSRMALRVKFLVAELNAWQTAYAFDIVRGAPQALLETAPARIGFLNSSRALSYQLSLLGAMSEVLTFPEREQLVQARSGFQEFMYVNTNIIQMFRSGDPQLIRQASEMVMDRGTEILQRLNASASALASKIAGRAQVEANFRQATDRVLFTQLIWFFGVALTGILVFSLIVWSFWQQRARLLQQLEQLAHTDGLTNLTNRRAWNEEFPQRLERARRNQQPLTVAMIDLDHFKRYNDTFGHLEGDGLLRQMGEVLRSSFRTNDFIARYGGEEFAVAFENCDIEQAKSLLERLRLGMPRGQTFSAGITQTDGNQAPEVVLDRSDKALYQAKQNGRDRVQISLNPSTASQSQTPGNVTLILEPQISLEND